MLLIINEISIGSGSTITSSTLSIINAGVGIVISSSTALLTSVAILITIENISKLKLRYTKLRVWINFFTILCEKTLNQSVVDKKIDEKEALELKKIYNQYLDKRNKIMKSTKFKVEDIFSDVISKDFVSQEQITKIDTFFCQIIVNINIKINPNFLHLEKNQTLILNPLLLPITGKSLLKPMDSNQKTCCLGGGHYSQVC